MINEFYPWHMNEFHNIIKKIIKRKTTKTFKQKLQNYTNII